MKKTFIIMIAAAVSVMAVTSCGGGAEGPADEVMSKKAYTQAVAKYVHISDFHEGAAFVDTGNGCGYINKKGELITAAEHDDGYDYSDGFAIVYKGDKIHALNNKGQIEFTFPNGILPAEKFHDGMIAVCDTDNMKFGYINKKGKIAIPCKYDAADSFRNGKALTVTVKGYDEDEEEYEAIYSIIDTDGDVVENLTESDAEDYESVDEDFDDMLYVITEGESLRSSLEDLFW